jgi:hypothetical protein
VLYLMFRLLSGTQHLQQRCEGDGAFRVKPEGFGARLKGARSK